MKKISLEIKCQTGKDKLITVLIELETKKQNMQEARWHLVCD